MTSQKRDFRQELTDSIIEALEKGVSPWQQGWESGSPLQMPYNPTTEKSYRGGNVIGLMVAAMKKKYNDPRWLTYKQAESSGWQVIRGERGTQVEFWKPVNRDEEENIGIFGDGKDNDKTKFIHRVYTVFNANQIEGIPELPPKFNNEWESIQSAETILKNSGVPIIHSNQDRAFYRKSSDTIFLPLKTAFLNAAEYYGTALHELAHASGASHRLNRETLTASDGFGTETYAREELRAELASVFLAAERGIPYNLENNAAYIEGWLDALKKDKNEIFRAARDAHRATDFLLAFENSNSLNAALAAVNGKPANDAEVAAEPTVEAARETPRNDSSRNEAAIDGKYFIPNVPYTLNGKMREMGCRWDRDSKQWFHTDPTVQEKAVRLANETLERSQRREHAGTLDNEKMSDFQSAM